MTVMTPAILRMIVLPALLVGATSCAGMGTLADVLASAEGAYGTPNELTGEVRLIDTRRQEIEIVSGWGRSDRVTYDGRTQVIYRQRRYDVRDLERGDLVWMRVDARRGELYTSRIEVQQGAQEGPGRYPTQARIQRFEGAVLSIDDRRGTFDIDQGRLGSVVTVALPYDASRAVRDRFRRLRRGDRVRVEAHSIDPWTVELRRFL